MSGAEEGVGGGKCPIVVVSGLGTELSTSEKKVLSLVASHMIDSDEWLATSHL